MILGVGVGEDSTVLDGGGFSITMKLNLRRFLSKFKYVAAGCGVRVRWTVVGGRLNRSEVVEVESGDV